ncbi:MAG: HAMP domain-containing histidine kinase [Bacteroidaceae bacterium]|nr:HAMP domain-containing histidine kinase [Bacteroidaceae bacterium]
MKLLSNFRKIKVLLIIFAAVIAASSLWVSNMLVDDLKEEEVRKMKMWASAMGSLISAEENADVTLEQEILSSNSTIPVILTDETGSIIQYNNIVLDEGADTLAVLMERVADMRRGGRVIPVPMGEWGEQYACYDDSMILTQLFYYPYVQLTVVLLFFVICFVAILSSKRAEQNRVWVGLSKETAHQLGTPISSLMAWTTVLKEKYPDDELLPEMERDVARLQMVAERFSKIGSKPEPASEDLVAVVERAVEYVKHRSPSNVIYEVNFPKRPLLVRVNAPLIEWVIENLCKNSIDAMNGAGTITVTVTQNDDKAFVDVCDTGKGLPKSQHKRVFEPGFTTKKRGWGLGLSLAKRIMQEYHKGRIYVKSSAPGKGAIFRIELKK